MHREPAGAAEDVEHPRALRQGAHERPVVTLVEEVTGLLTVDHVGFERETELEELDRPIDIGPVQRHALLQPVQVEISHRTGEPKDHRPHGEQLDEQRDECRQVRDPRCRVDLDDGDVPVAVDDQSGQRVVLAVHDPVASGRDGRRRLFESGAPLASSVEASAEELRIDRCRTAAVQDLHPDRGVRIPQPDGDELTILVEHHCQVAGDCRHG